LKDPKNKDKLGINYVLNSGFEIPETHIGADSK